MNVIQSNIDPIDIIVICHSTLYYIGDLQIKMTRDMFPFLLPKSSASGKCIPK